MAFICRCNPVREGLCECGQTIFIKANTEEKLKHIHHFYDWVLVGERWWKTKSVPYDYYTLASPECDCWFATGNKILGYPEIDNGAKWFRDFYGIITQEESG